MAAYYAPAPLALFILFTAKEITKTARFPVSLRGRGFNKRGSCSVDVLFLFWIADTINNLFFIAIL